MAEEPSFFLDVEVTVRVYLDGPERPDEETLEARQEEAELAIAAIDGVQLPSGTLLSIQGYGWDDLRETTIARPG